MKPHCWIAGAFAKWRVVSLFTLDSSLLILVAACNPGAYPFDIYPEMHYQVSQRRLEPDRLSPPPGAVPISGGKADLTFEQATNLPNPIPRNPESMDPARRVFRVNCSMCHGQDGHGQSVVAAHFTAAKMVPPVDFASERAQSRTDGQLYWIVTNGLGNMPPFGSLLTDEETWGVVNVIREVQGR